LRKRRGPGRPRVREKSRVRATDLRAETAAGGTIQQVLVVDHDGSFLVMVRVSWKRGYHSLRESRDRTPRWYHSLDWAVAAVRPYYAGVVMVYQRDDPALLRIKPFWPSKPASGTESETPAGSVG
jgi:hypothetical protein